MTDKHSLPDDFDPWLAADALKGLTEALYWFLTEGPAADQPMSRGTHSSLIGLSWAARRLARELHAYMAVLSEAGVVLPMPESPDNEIGESAAGYALN